MSDETAATDNHDVSESVSIKGPGGIGIDLKGTSQQVLTVILVVVLACGLAYGLWQHDQGMKADKEETVAAWKDVKKAMHEVKDTQTAMIYVLTLNEKDRAKLNLGKPKALRGLERE